MFSVSCELYLLLSIVGNTKSKSVDSHFWAFISIQYLQYKQKPIIVLVAYLKAQMSSALFNASISKIDLPQEKVCLRPYAKPKAAQ